MPHEACFDSFEAEMLEPCGLSAIWVLSTFSSRMLKSKNRSITRFLERIVVPTLFKTLLECATNVPSQV